MLFSDLKGRKVVSTSTADTVGKVKGFRLDPATRSVALLELKKTDEGSVVAWSDLVAVGADAVTVADAATIVEATDQTDPLAGKQHAVLKKRVLTDAGEELGKVHDIDLDPETGGLVALVLDGGPTVAGTRLLGIGSWAVVVAAG